MNRKLHRILDEIQKTEEKISTWQKYLDELNIRLKMLEDAEIIKSVRSMRLGSRELLSALEGIQNGTVILSKEQETELNSEGDGYVESMNKEAMNNGMSSLAMEDEVSENIKSKKEDLRNEREN